MKKTSKIISILLCVCLIFSSISVCAFAADDSLKLTVAADTHLQTITKSTDEVTRENQTYTKGMMSDDIFYYASLQGEMDYESTAIIKSMLASFVNSDSEYLLIAGDLTDGRRQSHIEMARLLADAENDSGKEIFVIPGNHDCAKTSDDEHISITQFKSIYGDFGYNQALATDTSSSSYAVDLSDKYRLLAIDSCIYGEDTGKISTGVMNFITKQTERAKADGKNVIAMMHHSLLKHYAVQPMISNYRSISKKFATLGIKTVFTGHIHANDISSATDLKGNKVYDIQTGSLITSPCSFRTVEFTDEKIDIKCDYVDEIDINDLPSGYSEEQKESMRDDFSSYAAKFYESGICRWLNRNIGSAGKIGKKLKLKETSGLYKALDKILQSIGDTMALDLYDTGNGDSIEAHVKNGGGSLEKSEFTRFYQLAARVMNSFFAGTNDSSDRDTRLLLTAVKSVLAKGISDNFLGGKAEKLLFKMMYGSKILDSILLYLTRGLTSDMSAPSDLDVTINLQQ